MRRWIALLAMVLAGCATTSARPPVDILIRGGTVYPGGVAPFLGDVAVRNGRIVRAGPRLALAARRTIDARGLIVAPGFIDPHAHIETWLTSEDETRRLAGPFLLQGVTTAFVGNDGFGPVDVRALLASASERPVGINYGSFIGFGSIRTAVIGAGDRVPAPGELARMQELVARALCEGAMGISAGLYYAPQSFARTDEVIALAKTAGALGGIYDTHLRDEGSGSIGLAAAVEEAIAIARAARIPVHISHIKALGPDVHGTAPAIAARIEAARAEGLAITADQYPWLASGTSLVAALVPAWAQDGGRAAMLRRLDDPVLRERLHAEMAQNLRRRGGASSLVLIAGRWKGEQLDTIARTLGLPPVAAAIAAIRDGDAAALSFNMHPADVASFMRRPWVVTGSDASAGHPRSHGSFAEVYAVHVRDAGLLNMRQFIDRSSTTTAAIFGLSDRGRIAPGFVADIAVFDPARFAARATYERPELTAIGMRHVLVGGVPAVADGVLTGAAAGRALSRPSARGCPASPAS